MTLARARILVVEDDAPVRKLLVRLLAPEHDVEEAVDGEYGLTSALARMPDLVLTDISMPRRSGDVMMRELRLRPEFDDVPFVVLTALTDPDLRIRLLQAGAQDYVLKPFAPGEVMARVTNLLAVKRVRELLQHEVADQHRDLVTLARNVVSQQHELEAALGEMTLARDEAREASAVKITFMSLVSHELLTPLTAMRLSLQVALRRTGRDPDADQKTLEQIMASSARLTGLVESVLELARVDRANTRLRVESFDARALARSVADEFTDLAARKGIAVDVDVGEGGAALMSDARVVRRVLRALMDNAVKFTAHGGVRVAVDAAGTGVRLAVEDTGPGVALGDQARIFHAFETGEAVRNKHTSGLGVGLAIARASVELLGGEIGIQSRPGKGTTFTVGLPSMAA